MTCRTPTETTVNSTGRVEVYALRDILLNEELGTDYGAPFWYQAHNGLTNREQAHQIQTYYRRSTLPWFAKNSSTPGPQRPAGHTPTQATPTKPSGLQAAQPIIDLCSPSTPTEGAPHIEDHQTTAAPEDMPLHADPEDMPLPAERSTPPHASISHPLHQ